MIPKRTIGEELCLSCGLCCNGVLFKDVELQPGDRPARLTSLGLSFKRPSPKKSADQKGPIAKLPQPCAALCPDNLCQIYQDRPTRCREFECALFKKVLQAEVELPAALRVVQSTRRRADKVRNLLRELGDTDVSLALSLRFKRTRKRLESSPVSETQAELFAELSLAVHELNFVLSQRFYPGSDHQDP